MIKDNKSYIFVDNEPIGTSIGYDHLNKAIQENRNREWVEDIRIGPPIDKKIRVGYSKLGRLVGIYIKPKVKGRIGIIREDTAFGKINLEQALEQLDELQR